MSTRYITAEFDSNFPGPGVDCVLAQLRTLSNGSTPVSTRDIAASVGGDGGAVADALRRASNNGLVRQVRGGWVPTSI
jgi:hypothetical protein